ncbi:hypothetical protein [Roseateles sp.]|uniref:hypothetical protein n=1 Tax=Roseateles sp. TaxID=1971397 RepID=UPI003D119ABB
MALRSELGSPAAIEASLNEAEALLAAEAYEAVLSRTRGLLDVLEAAGSASLRPLARRIYQLRGDCLTRLDRFSELLQDSAAMLDLLSVDQASAERAELMIKMSFAHANLAMPEQALRAAHVAVQDALALGQRMTAAQALERVAMAYLSMGDGVAAERFMFEALDHSDESSPPLEQLRRTSNAMHLLCTLHDAYQDMGLSELADAVLARARGLPARAEQWLPQVPGRYMVCMWQANQARCWRRSQRLAEAQAMFEDCVAEGGAQGWHAVRRPVQLELALMAEARGDLDQALQLLNALFEPANLRVRDVVALPAYRMLERVCRGLGQAQAAEQAGRQLRARQLARQQASLEAATQTQGLAPMILAALAAADRQRLEAEIQRLRSEPEAGARLHLPDSEAWFKLGLP